MYSLATFDYHLPIDLIAQYPPERNEDSRLMVLNRKLATTNHETFSHVVNYLNEGDILVVNDSKVIPARLFGRKATGGRIEILLLNYPFIHPGESISEEDSNSCMVECLVRASKRPVCGSKFFFDEDLAGEVIRYDGLGRARVKLYYKGKFKQVLRRLGKIPLPPYIKRPPYDDIDGVRYQTIFAHKDGSVAAPTAGLHFSQELIDKIREKGVSIVPVTLHVSYGTFSPVRTTNIRDHKMDEEIFEISEESAEIINGAKREGRRVVAVGTTTTRLLEYMGTKWGSVKAGYGLCDLFIYPGHQFKLVDSLITNFHLPKSTLVIMVSAFAGRHLIMEAYQKAIRCRYRFYSYGDAMLIL